MASARNGSSSAAFSMLCISPAVIFPSRYLLISAAVYWALCFLLLLILFFLLHTDLQVPSSVLNKAPYFVPFEPCYHGNLFVTFLLKIKEINDPFLVGNQRFHAGSQPRDFYLLFLFY